MRTLTIPLNLITAVALLALAFGCATRKTTENLLASAGFKIVPASTTQQQSHLKTLPAYKISKLESEGKTWFIYPDPARQVLYIGDEAQYEGYKNLRWQSHSQIAQDQKEGQVVPYGQEWQVWRGNLVAPLQVVSPGR
jgi:hypothetical protein